MPPCGVTSSTSWCPPGGKPGLIMSHVSFPLLSPRVATMYPYCKLRRRVANPFSHFLRSRTPGLFVNAGFWALWVGSAYPRQYCGLAGKGAGLPAICVCPPVLLQPSFLSSLSLFDSSVPLGGACPWNYVGSLLPLEIAGRSSAALEQAASWGRVSCHGGMLLLGEQAGVRVEVEEG